MLNFKNKVLPTICLFLIALGGCSATNEELGDCQISHRQQWVNTAMSLGPSEVIITVGDVQLGAVNTWLTFYLENLSLADYIYGRIWGQDHELAKYHNGFWEVVPFRETASNVITPDIHRGYVNAGTIRRETISPNNYFDSLEEGRYMFILGLSIWDRSSFSETSVITEHVFIEFEI